MVVWRLCKKIKLALVAVFVVLGLSACAPYMGQKISDSYTDSITKGVTTKSELESTLGKPTLYFYGEDSQPLYVWSYAESGILSLGVKMKTLVVSFDDQDRVKQASFSHIGKR